MSEIAVPSTDMIGVAASRTARLAASIGRALARIILARATRRALNGLPDEMLGDIGLSRSDIPVVVEAIASEGCLFNRARHEQRLAS